MSTRLLIRGKAKLDLAEAALWYEQKRAGLGDEFLAAVNAGIDQIVQFPKSFPIIERGNIRRTLVNRFPYAIYFVDVPDAIAVLAVFHTSRDVNRLLRRRL